ncbi:hypothetical protein THAOC_24124 [Thalassiosira oceanica]|uniref:Uncharacterized protein n=1 Tax=Thalassiosira oceanica TaxID=159749 RepID=K0SBE1_THAOC|nr:hypothetical protein THAOC_24124 [Thalassiosira oceanica]|eukprot:EJK56057.1 hypothetical protein THAOC_24124 [Thalassiosira oceanica]
MTRSCVPCITDIGAEAHETFLLEALEAYGGGSLTSPPSARANPSAANPRSQGTAIDCSSLKLDQDVGQGTGGWQRSSMAATADSNLSASLSPVRRACTCVPVPATTGTELTNSAIHVSNEFFANDWGREFTDQIEKNEDRRARSDLRSESVRKPRPGDHGTGLRAAREGPQSVFSSKI